MTLKTGNTCRDREQDGDCQRLRGKEMENYCLIGRTVVLESEKVMKMGSGVGRVSLSGHTITKLYSSTWLV